MAWALRDDSRIYGRLNYTVLPIPNKDGKALQFKVSRNDNVVEPRIFNTFKNVVEGNAHLESKGMLGEDRVPVDRDREPLTLLNFENQVILSLTEAINSPFELKLAIYNPGYLLGTEILLFRLIDYLKRMKASGEIQLFLIDSRYQDSIQKSIGGKQIMPVDYISQFVKDICLALPSSIKVQGTFFASSEDYLQMANQHHLLIGPQDAKDLAALNKGVKKAPITLGKNIKTCELKLSGKFEEFYSRSDRITGFAPMNQNPVVPKVNDEDKTMTFIIGGGVIFCIAIGVAFLARRTLSSK